MPRFFLGLILFGASLALASCSGNRVDIVDATLDRTLYSADTKAERLLRYFEVQALLVRFAAETGAGSADRNSMALANVAATAQLNTLTECLQVGSLNMRLNNSKTMYVRPYSVNLNQSVFVRNSSAYCSFFESRLISYQDALFAMLRQAAHDDATAQLLNEALTGANVLNFGNFVSTLVQAASSLYRDERVLRAFTADALELEYIVWEPTATSSDQIYSFCPGGVQCDDTTLPLPERAGTNLEVLRVQLGGDQSSNRPEIRVWHFQEVYAFMIAACRSLNGDIQAMPNVKGTQCSASPEFPFPLQSNGQPPKPQPPVVAQPPAQPHPGPTRPIETGSDVVNQTVAAIDAVAEATASAFIASGDFAKASGKTPLDLLKLIAQGHDEVKADLDSASAAYETMQKTSATCADLAQQAKALASGPDAATKVNALYNQALQERANFFKARDAFVSAKDKVVKAGSG